MSYMFRNILDLMLMAADVQLVISILCITLSRPPGSLVGIRDPCATNLRRLSIHDRPTKLNSGIDLQSPNYGHQTQPVSYQGKDLTSTSELSTMVKNGAPIQLGQEKYRLF